MATDEEIRTLTGAWLAIAGRIRSTTIPALRARASAAFEVAGQLPTMIASDRAATLDAADALSAVAYDTAIKAATAAIESRAFGWDQEAARLQGFAEASERHASELILLSRAAQDASTKPETSDAAAESQSASEAPPRAPAEPSESGAADPERSISVPTWIR